MCLNTTAVKAIIRSTVAPKGDLNNTAKDMEVFMGSKRDTTRGTTKDMV